MNARPLFEALFAWIKDEVPAIAGRISRGEERPGEKKPSIIVHHIGGEETLTHDGDSHDTERTVQLQFDCLALNLSDSDEIAEALRAALSSAVNITGAGAIVLAVVHDSPFGSVEYAVASTSQKGERIARTIQPTTITFTVT